MTSLMITHISLNTHGLFLCQSQQGEDCRFFVFLPLTLSFLLELSKQPEHALATFSFLSLFLAAFQGCVLPSNFVFQSMFLVFEQ